MKCQMINAPFWVSLSLSSVKEFYTNQQKRKEELSVEKKKTIKCDIFMFLVFGYLNIIVNVNNNKT